MDFEVVETIKEEEGEGTCVMESLCRVCACFSELLLPIFDGEGLKHDLPDKIKQHLPITVRNSDRLPLKICYQCASTVISWHDLVASCRSADQKLRTMLKSSVDQLQNSSEDCNDVEAADVAFSGEVYDLNTDETESSLRNIGSNMKSAEEFTANSEMRDGAMASISSEGGNPERCIGLTEDCGEKLIEEENMGNLISLRFGPQIDHSYTRLPSSEPPVAPKAVKPDPPRSLRPILPKPRETVITSVFNSQISVSTKSSVANVKEHIEGPVSPQPPKTVVTPLFNTEISVSTESSEVNVTDHMAGSVSPKPPKTVVTPLFTKSSVASVEDDMAGSAPQFLFCTKMQKGVSNQSKKAVLVPLSNVRKAMTTTQPNVQKTTASLKSKSSVLRLSVLKKSHPNVSVTITPVQKVSRAKPVNVGPSLPSLTITPVQKKPSSVQYRHVSKSLTGEKTMRFTCRVCNAEFLHEVVRRLHMFRSHGLKQYMCDICNTGFGMSHELKAHMRKRHVMEKRDNPETPLKYPCNLCNLSFLWHRDLLLHKREKHSNLVKTVSMEQKKEKKVVAGVQVSEKEKEMLKEFHTVIDSRDWYHCKECMKSWQSRDKAVLHIRTHTKERMYACEICDQKFNTPGVLRRHRQVHEGKKPFPCAYCEKTFSSKQNRDDHHRFHTKEVKTVCETCGEFLTSASMLYYHRKIHSGITPYVCPYCNKAYAIRALLKRHIRFHTGEKPHLCSVCGRGFNTSGQLRGHSLVHTDSRPFSCDKCGTKMKSTKYLNRHKAICQSSRAK